MLSSVPARLGSTESALRPALGPLWRPFAAQTPYLDVGAAVGGRGPRVAYAALSLEASQTADRWLFIGTDDAVSVLLDGHEVFRSTAVRASRDDDDAVALHLARGAHSLVLKLASGGDIDLFARITDRRFHPDPTVTLRLDGVDNPGCNELARRATAIHVERAVTTEGTRLDAHVSFPGGSAALEGETTRTIRISAVASAPVNTSISLGSGFISDQTASVVLAQNFNGPIDITVGSAALRATVNLDPRAARAVLRARRVLGPLDSAFNAPPSLLQAATPTGALPPRVIWSVERAAERLAELLSNGDPDAAYITSETAALESLLDAVEARRDPYETLRGPLRRAYRSALDGRLQEYSLYVPPSYRPTRDAPLVMTLHGLHGSAHRMLPITFGIFDESENRTHAERHLPPLPDGPAIVVAPWAHGDTGYRHQGESDPMRVLDEVRASYHIDPARTYITGLSMGGIGAAALPLHHPGVFAATAPLCGYHSYLVRGDTQGPRQPWETFLMEMRSNASWAENGSHLPMYIVQGTLDRPLVNSTVLSDRYAELHYTLQTEWPRLGHNVWSQTYANGRIFQHFLRFHRDLSPRSVRFRSPDLRWRQSDWVTLDRISHRGQWAEVTALAERTGSVRVSTQNLDALTLSAPRSLFGPGVTELAVTLDRDALRVPVTNAVSFVRTGSHWAVGARPTEPAHGPVREVQDGPMLFVYGASDASEARLNERVAEGWARRSGARVSYSVVRDDSYTEPMGAGRTLVLVGSPRSNSVLARMMPRLPIHIDTDSVTVGARHYRGVELGVVFVTHDPDSPGRAVLVISGPEALGTWRSRSLPELLPDYVVYDRAVAPARGRVLLGGHARVLSAGFL